MARYLPSSSRGTLPLRHVLGTRTSGSFTRHLLGACISGALPTTRYHLGISWERAPPAHSLGVAWRRTPPAHSPGISWGARLQLIYQASPGNAHLRRAHHPIPPTVPASSGVLQTRTSARQWEPSSTGGSCLRKGWIRMGAFRASPTPISCTLTYAVRPRTSRIMPAQLRSSSILLPVPQHRA